MLQALLFTIAALASFAFAPVHSPEPQFQAALPSATAVFETSLAAPITSSATSLTLTANAVRGGGSLSGYTCFTIDEGSAQHEVVCGTVSGTSVTSLTRGISFATGTTTDSDNQFAHRRGANVKITDFPILQILKAQANGEDTYPNILKYASHPTFSATTDIVDKKYVDDAAFSGAAVIDATTAARGVVEIATQIEAASSTTNGSSGILAIPASSATSTWNSLTAALRVIVSQNNGKIDNGFIATSTMFTSQPFSVGAITTTGVSNIASTSLKSFTSSTTPTTTWTKPSNLKYVIVEVQGGGGAGGGASGSPDASGGGGSGGYCKKIIPAAALGSTETVTVGVGGVGVNAVGPNGGPSSFGSHCTTTGGTGGVYEANGNAAGGTASGGDINIAGGQGRSRISTSVSGEGSDSILGLGGALMVDNEGVNATGYGAGGGGAASTGGQNRDGGDGTVGAVFVWEVFY